MIKNYSQEVLSIRAPPFSQSSSRFTVKEVFYGQSYKLDVPGPGYYNDQQPRKQASRNISHTYSGGGRAQDKAK